MNDEQNHPHDADGPLPEPDDLHVDGPTPGGLTWPIRRFYWFVEKHFLWPVADTFKRVANSFSYRSPLAYIGTTMLLTLTGAAIGAAVYFHNEADNPPAVTAQAPVDPETVIAATPTPPPPATVVPENKAKADDTLKGVVPDFENSSDTTTSDKGSGSDQTDKPKLPATVVKPTKVPDSPPLKVAHNFAETFVDYEVGKQGVARDFQKTATTKLSKELKADPPRQPSNGKIPKATVMNVLKGKKKAGKLDVSVSLMRSGATSELRLALTQEKNKWLVSEVRG